MQELIKQKKIANFWANFDFDFPKFGEHEKVKLYALKKFGFIAFKEMS